MADNGLRFELGARNTSALAANFRRLSETTLGNIRRQVRESAGELHALTDKLAARDTEFMANHIQEWITANGYAFEVGWDAMDFYEAGHPFYPPFVEFGTRYMMAQPALGPAADQVFPRHSERISEIIRNGVADFGRGR